MLLSKYLKAFTFYNLLLIIFFSLSVNRIESFFIINSLSYVLFHYVIIYLGLYYYCKKLYLIYFFFGLGVDIFLLDQIGPHLFVFMLLLVFFHQTKNYLKNFNSNKIYLTILLIQIFIILLEMIFADIFFSYKLDFYNYFKLSFISLIISYPIFYFFSKIDNLN